MRRAELRDARTAQGREGGCLPCLDGGAGRTHETCILAFAGQTTLPTERISGGHTSVGAMPASYQVTPAILGRWRATQPMQVRLRPTRSI